MTDSMPDEEWRPIEGARFYEVSSLGRLRSLDREIRYSDGRVQQRRGRVRKIFPNTLRYPYMQTNIRFDDGVLRTCKMHVLVCRAFHGPPPSPQHEVRHLNGRHDDNRPENLRWGTKSENMFDRVRHGNHHQAQKTHCKYGHPFDEENTTIASKDGRPTRCCRTCVRERARKGRAEWTDEQRERQREYERRRHRDPEERRRQAREWYARNREEILARRRQRKAERKAA